MKTANNFKLKFQPGEIRRNLPILLKVDCSSGYGIYSMDGKYRYDGLEFIPLRLDYSQDAYEGKPIGLLLCLAISGDRIEKKTNKRVEVPSGLSIYLMLKSSRTMQGSLDNFQAMKTAVEQIMETMACGLIWAADFEEKSGSIVDDSGKIQPIKYARVHWQVREMESETEENLLNQLSAEFEQSEFFEEICGIQNEIIAQLDSAAREGELKRLESSSDSEQKALAGS